MNAAVMDYARTLRPRWRWIVWGMLLALMATTALLVLWPPLYRSEATIFVRTPGDVSRVRDGGSTYAAARANTYAALARSTGVAARVITELGLDLDPETLSGRITAVNPPGTALIDISVRAPSAAEAQRTATVLIAEYAGTVRALESVPGSLVPRAEFVVVDAPGPAARVSLWGASIPVVLLCAALLGLVLGLVAAVMGSIFSSSARDRRDTSPITQPPDADPSAVGVADAIVEGNRLNLKALLTAVRRYWVTFVMVTAVLFALGLTWILLLPAKFVSSTQLMVSIEGSTTATAYQNDDVVAGRISSYIPLLTSGVVDQRVIDRLRLPLTTSELAAKINATRVPPKTAIIDVEVTDELPARAQLIAQTVAREFISYTEALETPTGEDSQKVHTTVVTAATEAHEKRFERLLLAMLAGVAALLMGAVAVWIRARTDAVIRTAGQAAAGGVPVLGTVIASVSADDLAGYHHLRTQLQSMTDQTSDGSNRGAVLMLTSPVGEVETTHVASNLCDAFKLAGSRSIMVDAEELVPQTSTDQQFVSRASGNGHRPGRAGDTKWPENNKADTLDRARITVLTATKRVLWGVEHGGKRLPEVPAQRPRSAELIDGLRSEYEHVIIAAPPVMSKMGAAMMEHADVVILVLAMGETRGRDLRHAAESVQATGGLTGALLIGKYRRGEGSDGPG
jgi:capsular polysaccharide biosynthesis protein